MTANVRQLIVPESRTGHCHPSAAVPRAAGGDARPAVDALALISNKDLSHSLFQLFASAMALDTLLKIANVRFGVYLRHLCLGMVVAAIAAIRCIVGGVTRLARGLFAIVSVRKGKTMFHQAGGSPGGRSVTRGAAGAELPAMHGRVRVALCALARRVTKAIVDMAFVARHRRMLEL